MEQEDIYVKLAFEKLNFLSVYSPSNQKRISNFLKYYYTVSIDTNEDPINDIIMKVYDIVGSVNVEKLHCFLLENPLEFVEIYKLKEQNAYKRKKFKEKLKDKKDINNLWNKLKKTKLYTAKMRNSIHICCACKKSKEGSNFSNTQLKRTKKICNKCNNK
jgi:hypothetical protein